MSDSPLPFGAPLAGFPMCPDCMSHVNCEPTSGPLIDRPSLHRLLSNCMVTHFLPASSSSIPPDVYRAIADPTRRAILDHLRAGPAPVNSLASRFSQSRPAISKHLRVLRSAHLVRERRCGRERRYSLEPEPLRDVARWIEEYRAFWQTNLNSLKRHLEHGTGRAE